MLKRTLPLLTLLLVLLALGAIGARADDALPTLADWARNTKETSSNLLPDEHADDDAPTVESTFPLEDAAIQSRLADAFRAYAVTVDNPSDACEPAVLSGLRSALAAAALPSDPAATRLALYALRSKNLVDDVTLAPLLAAFPVWAELGYRPEDWVKKDSEGREAKIACPTETFLSAVIGPVKRERGRKAKRKDYAARIRGMAGEKNDQGVLRHPSTEIAWLEALNRSAYDTSTPFVLPHVLEQVANAKNSSDRAVRDESPSRFLSKRSSIRGLSNRQALYKKYNSIQIKMLAELWATFRHRVLFADPNLSIPIPYTDGTPTEHVDLSPMERERLLKRILHKSLEELSLTTTFQGQHPTFDESLVASIETGEVHGDEVEACLTIDDLWNPKVTVWEKASKFARKYAGPALILVPNPVSFWASLILTLGEAAVDKKFKAHASADERGISLF